MMLRFHCHYEIGDDDDDKNVKYVSQQTNLIRLLTATPRQPYTA